MKSVEIVSISLPIELIHTIDHRRHDISRSKFVQRMIESGFETLCKSNAIQETDFTNTSDEVSDDNHALRKGPDSTTFEIKTAKNSLISWLNH